MNRDGVGEGRPAPRAGRPFGTEICQRCRRGMAKTPACGRAYHSYLDPWPALVGNIETGEEAPGVSVTERHRPDSNSVLTRQSQAD